MIKLDKLNPFGKMCLSMGMIPSSYAESLTYEEQLIWFCNFLEKQVIPAINKEGEAIEELQNLYTELKNYVDEYFENLDVQEEINNKLDDMAESGQLTDIIAQYLGLAGVLAFNTISDMSDALNIAEGSICYTLGQSSYNDGKGAFYKVRTITSGDTVDGFNIVALDVSDTLIAERMPNYYINTINNTINTINNSLSLINNKKYIFIGDSYLVGYTPDGIIENWGTKLVNILGLNSNQYIINGYGGSGFVRTDTKTFTQMINELTSDNEVTDIVVCGGYNDIGASENTLLEFMTTFKTACNTKFPNAKIHVGHIGWTTNPSNIFSLCLNVGNYKKLSAKLGFNYLSNVEYILKDYFSMFTSDKIHPNNTGQEALAYNIASALIGGSANVQYDFKNITITPTSDYEVQQNGNFASSVKNELTTIYCESPIVIGKTTAIDMSCSNIAYEIGDISNGYVLGTTYGTVKIPVTCVMGIYGGFDKVNGTLIINNGKLYLSLYDVNSSGDNFKTLIGVYLIQIMCSTTTIDSLMC